LNNVENILRKSGFSLSGSIIACKGYEYLVKSTDDEIFVFTGTEMGATDFIEFPDISSAMEYLLNRREKPKTTFLTPERTREKEFSLEKVFGLYQEAGGV